MPADPSFLNRRKLDLSRPGSQRPQEHVNSKKCYRCAHCSAHQITHYPASPICPAGVAPGRLRASATGSAGTCAVCHKTTRTAHFEIFSRFLKFLKRCACAHVDARGRVVVRGCEQILRIPEANLPSCGTCAADIDHGSM